MADESTAPPEQPDHINDERKNRIANPPVYQSKLRAKREERMQQQQAHKQNQDEATPSQPATHQDTTARIAPVIPGDPLAAAHLTGVASARSSTRSTGTEEARRRQRAEARRLLIEFSGNAWDVVRVNNLAMLGNFFLVEGAAKLIQAHCKDVDEFGRTLLHTAAWWGCVETAQYLISNGATINEIDTVATRLTPLMDAARAGHIEIALLLLMHGADATMRDASGDNAFHWAARHAHGTFLLRVSLALDTLDHNALIEAWTAKNVRGRTPADYIRAHPTIFPMITKRLGTRVPLHHSTTSVTAQRHRPSISGIGPPNDCGGVEISPSDMLEGNSSRPRAAQSETLSSVDALGIDVGSFAYKSRDSVSSH